jgi:hypothetical protein
MKQLCIMPNIESSPSKNDIALRLQHVDLNAYEEMARARGAVFGTFFGASFWVVVFLCWKFVA